MSHVRKEKHIVDKIEQARELLRIVKPHITSQATRTIKGQMKAGDYDGAITGMKRIIRRKGINND